jgi:hypothetical protein
MRIFVSVTTLSLLSSFDLALSSMASTSFKRSFQFVDYGASAPTGVTTISCDGRVEGTTLELTHWPGNETPDQYYADTSTEMALKFAKEPLENFENAVVLNNHYDTDGVLSVWACLEPQEAMKYEQLLKEGAEAGDFGEWNSDQGVKLDCAISEFCTGNEEEASFQSVLKEMPNLVKDMIITGGKSYERYWKSGFERALAGWEDLEQGRATLSRGPENIVILKEAGKSSRLSAYALHRGLREYNLWKDTTRILRVTRIDNNSNQYSYEKIGHGWVQKLVDRHIVPNADSKLIAKKLNEGCCDGGSWKDGGSGLISICQTWQSCSMSPEKVAAIIAECDERSR